MPDRAEIAELIARTESYLNDRLLPFWIENSPDPEFGGFLSYFDRHGRPTGETLKSFLMQVRILYAMASSHRFGYGAGGRCAKLARDAADFLLEHYWDREQGGWFWIADRAGNPTVTSKIGYGQVFGMYAFSEYFLATGDPRGRQAAEQTYAAISQYMADTRHGGFYEMMGRDWQAAPSGPPGGDRKSLDVHMHMMEALTSLYEMTGHPIHRRRLEEVIDLLTSRMLQPNGTGYIQFTTDFQPLGAILFATEWGRDARPRQGALPLDQTSPGHNVEFAWLLLHAAEVMGRPWADYADVVRPMFDHCLAYGIDWDFGGVYADTPAEGPTTLTEKQFWQQGEIIVGMLDAYRLFGDEKYWRAFRNVYDFLFDKFVVMDAGGEWYERVDREGRPIDDVLGHAWKICYHSIRSTVQAALRLRALAGTVE
ncbi:MAG: Cellobiose 2-epimerase [Phycisphaerae bacterium]|nr:Cellobiose 2-epimerase [Phycisphaerae bacterium]